MKKKTIQPVTFSEVYTEVREQVMNECVRQKTAPVDPGSGSGSGSGSGGSGGVSSFMGTNSCTQEVSSRFGGSWTMVCTVTWVATPGYAEVTSPDGSATFIVEINLEISSIVLSFEGNPSGNATPYPFSEKLGPFYLSELVSSGEATFTLLFSNRQLDLSVEVSNKIGNTAVSDRKSDPKKLKSIVVTFSTTPGYNGNPPSLTFSSCNVCLEDGD